MGFFKFFTNSNQGKSGKELQLIDFPLAKQITGLSGEAILMWAKEHYQKIEKGKSVLVLLFDSVKEIDSKIQALEQKIANFQNISRADEDIKNQDSVDLNNLILEKGKFDEAIRGLQKTVYDGIEVLSQVLQACYKDQDYTKLLEQLYVDCPKIKEFLQDSEEAVNVALGSHSSKSHINNNV